MLAVGRSEITCAPIKYVTIHPPSGQSQTCQQYLSEYINNFGGYLMNLDVVDGCQFYMWIYIAFNVRRLV
jgi:hypothetical protein